MKTLASRSRIACAVGSLVLGSAPGLFAGDLILQKVPPLTEASDSAAPRPTDGEADENASFGMISYNQAAKQAKTRALYVSSGADVKQANNMIDDQTSTSYNFSAEDAAPTTMIDLGSSRSLRRLSAAYTPRAGSMSFYVLSALPGAAADAATGNFTLTDEAFASMKSIGSASDDGSQGRASIEFPETTGRYVMVRWTPAAEGNGFTMAEIAATGAPGQNNLLAANTNEVSGGSEMAEGSQTTDGKTVLDGKTMIDAKDMPGEGPGSEEAPQSPAEGPPPTLPQPPPFTFVPVLVPTSP